MTTETKEKSQDTPPEVGQPPEKKVTPKNEKTISEADYQKAVSDEKTISGRLRADLASLTTERDTLKRETQEATATLEETRQHISNLESDIEAFEVDEADPNKLSRLRKELRVAKSTVNLEVKDEKDAIAELRRTLEAEREEWAGTVAEAQTYKFDGELANLVDEYEGDVTANFTKLKTACDKAGVKTKEGADAIAETFLTKKGEEPDFHGDSGVNSGGTNLLSDLPIKERMEELNKRALSKTKV